MFVSFLRSSSSSRKVRGRPSSPAGGLCSCYAVNWPPHKSFQPCTRASYPCKGIWGKAHEDKPGALAKFAAIPAGRCQRQQRLMSDLCWCKVRCWWGAHSGSSISRPPQLSPLCKGSSPPAAAAAAVHTVGCHLHLAHPGRLSRTGTWRRRGRVRKEGIEGGGLLGCPEKATMYSSYSGRTRFLQGPYLGPSGLTGWQNYKLIYFKVQNYTEEFCLTGCWSPPSCKQLIQTWQLLLLRFWQNMRCIQLYSWFCNYFTMQPALVFLVLHFSSKLSISQCASWPVHICVQSLL